MLAIADGLGSSPVQMVVEDENSLLQKAVDLEAEKIAGPTDSGKEDVKVN